MIYHETRLSLEGALIDSQQYRRDDWDLGECSGIEHPGTALFDYTDAVPCERDAVVALFQDDKYKGLVLCEQCYLRHSERLNLA